MSSIRNQHSVLLSDGNCIPILGLGTCALDKPVKGETTEAVKTAIEVGYRHFDGALMYGNEDEVGEAICAKIADGTVKREDIFYTSKVWMTYLSPPLVQKALAKTLKSLQLDYVDLYLVHWPMALKPSEELFPKDADGKVLKDDVDFRETWLVECHPYLNQNKLLKYCQCNNIVLVGYSPLGTSRNSELIGTKNPILRNDPVLIKIGEKHCKTAAQVILRYQVQRGVVVIPKSFNPGRMKQNKEIFDFQLTDEEMESINGLNKDIRFIILEELIDHPMYPFHDEY
ncbi:aldo-keto reductase family 1 member D1-like isoform X1 [Rhinoraja longicauda]